MWFDNQMIIYHASAVYAWVGRGLTQEIASLHWNGEAQPSWAGRLWTEFLNDRAREGWEFIAAVGVTQVGGGGAFVAGSTGGCVAYFRRQLG